MLDQVQGRNVSKAATARMVEAMERATIGDNQTVLVGFGEAYRDLQALVVAAAGVRGNGTISPHCLLDSPDEKPTCFIGSPDQLFALLRAGYGHVLSHALIGGGAVFPIVHSLAVQHGVRLTDMMSDPSYGPYALRHARDEAYWLLDNVTVDIVQPGGETVMPKGMVGEVVLSEPVGDSAPVRTGVLSKLEQVPHAYRKPGLMGWMGLVQPTVRVEQSAVRAADLATLVGEHDEILDARLLAHAPAKNADHSDNGSNVPILQVETEAGAWIEQDLMESFEALTGLRPRVQRVQPGKFINTGRPFGLLAA